MSAVLALIIVGLVVAIPVVAIAGGGLTFLIGVVVPTVAVVVFVVGLCWRVVSWARSPVPFRIPTTCGQQRSLDFIRSANLDNPSTTRGVIGRMALETAAFRSLFRNTSTTVDADAMRVTHSENLLLWLAALAFHWSMLFIVLRHLRLVVRTPPAWLGWIDALDGFFEVGIPVIYASTVVFLAGLVVLLLRRIVAPRLRYLSLPQDYFALFLLLAIGTTGVLMRHVFRIDLAAAKDSVAGIAGLTFSAPQGVGLIFYIHLFLVSTLLIYFPFSKLVHGPGVFLSPTRNLANNNRRRRHINPWNPAIVGHTYAEWEEEFRDKIVGAGIPLDKE